MTVGKGLKVELFASEKEFPELVNPVQMAFDTKGRLWVAVWPNYPHWQPKTPMNDKLLILEDTNGDGKADKRTVFAGDLHNPTGFEFCNGGVLVAQPPNLRVPQGHQRRRQVRRQGDRPARPRLGRHAPRDQQLHVRSGRRALLPGRHLPPHAGRDRRGARSRARPTAASSASSRGRGSSRSTSRSTSPTRTATSSTAGAGTSSSTAPAASRTTGRRSRPRSTTRRWRPSKAPKPGDVRTRPVGGVEILSSRHFPEEMQGNLLVLNVIGFQGLLNYKLSEDGAGPQVDRGRADPVSRPTRTSARSTPRSARTARSTSSTGTTRSSATCSTTCATRPATSCTAASTASRYPGRPLLKPAQIAGAADPAAARPAEGAGGPRPLPRQDRAERARHEGGARRASRRGRPSSIRRIRTTSIT